MCVNRRLLLRKSPLVVTLKHLGNEMLEEMVGIAQKIESFNLAFRLAWPHISEHQKREPDIARRLHDSIRRQLNEGATEGLFIASEALKDIERS